MPFLTPDSQEAPRDGAFLITNINANQQILGLIDGAISPLFYSYNWQEFGSMTKEEASDYFNQIGVEIVTSLCQAIADCLTNPDSPAYQALMQQIGAYVDAKLPNVDKIGNPEAPIIKEENPLVIEPQGGCNEDNLYGAIVGLLNFANTTILDVFEKLEVATNSSEQIAIMLGAIPLFNSLPYDDILVYANQLQEELAELYAGEYTNVLRDNMACELFCEYRGTCELSFQDLADYFGGKVSLEIGNFTFEEGIAWLAQYNSAGDDVVYASHFLLFQVIAYGATFAGVDSGYLIRIANTLWNDPNPDWALLCTNCAWCHLDTTFTNASIWNSDGGTDNIGNWAQFAVGGVHRIDNAGGTNVRGAQVEMLYNFGALTTITKIVIVYDKEGTQYDNTLRGYKANDTGAWVYTQIAGQTSPNQFTVEFDFTAMPLHITSIRLGIGQGYSTTGTYNINTKITSIQFFGDGDIPFGWSGVC